MASVKSIYIYCCFAVLMLVAKPFIGFNAFNQSHPLTHLNILVKAFTKRKQEYIDGSNLDFSNTQKKLADPVKQLFLLFSFLLGIILPLTFGIKNNFSSSFLRNLRLSLSPRGQTYLLNSALVI